MALVRIDNRLIHGQIIETWLPHTGAKCILVANDELSSDSMQQSIMSLAIPQSVQSIFVNVENVQDELNTDGRGDSDTIVLFSNCTDAKRAFEAGFEYDSLNVGNVHYVPGKTQISPSVALSDDEEGCLRFLNRQGVELDFRCVPNDPVQVRF